MKQLGRSSEQMKRFADFWGKALERKGAACHIGSGRTRSDIEELPLKTFCGDQKLSYQTLREVVRGQKVPKDATILGICPALGMTSPDQQFLALLEACRARIPSEFADGLDPLIAKVERDISNRTKPERPRRK